MNRISKLCLPRRWSSIPRSPRFPIRSIASETLAGGKKVVRFADTIKMSTYLVAFIVGRIEPTEPVMVGQTPLRLWAVPGKKHLDPIWPRHCSGIALIF